MNDKKKKKDKWMTKNNKRKRQMDDSVAECLRCVIKL